MALLLLDIPSDSVFRDMTDGLTVVAPRPEGRDAGSQGFKLAPENAGGVALQLLDDEVRRVHRGRLDKEMQVIGHYFHLFNGDPKVGGPLYEQFPKTAVYFSLQYRFSVLRAPYQVVAYIVYRLVACSPSRFHCLKYNSSLYSCQLYNLFVLRIHPTTKVVGFLRNDS